MTSKSNLLFVINPIAGGKEKQHLQSVIERELNHSLFHYEFAYTESVDHARKLSSSAAYLGFDIVAAVGGDGTVNEVARGILERRDEEATLAIIPSGSGNGLARHLRIPMQTSAAVRLINELKTTRADVGLMNDIPFFCVAGIGFDAHISQLFAHSKTRGFLGYVMSALRELRLYQPGIYEVRAAGQTIRERAFLISIANSSQYGNDAYIAPDASITDGLLDVCILSPFPYYRYPEMALRLMTGRIADSRYMKIVRTGEASILREEEGIVHLDGEPKQMGRQLDIRVIPSSISIVVP